MGHSKNGPVLRSSRGGVGALCSACVIGLNRDLRSYDMHEHTVERQTCFHYLCSLFFDTFQQLVEYLVPTVERLGEIPGGRWTARSRSLFAGINGMQRGDKGSKKGFKELDKERFHSREEVIDIGELEDALVRDLRRGQDRSACIGQARTTKMSSRSFTNVHFTA